MPTFFQALDTAQPIQSKLIQSCNVHCKIKSCSTKKNKRTSSPSHFLNCFSIFNCCLTLSIVFQINKGEYPKNSHSVFCSPTTEKNQKTLPPPPPPPYLNIVLLLPSVVPTYCCKPLLLLIYMYAHFASPTSG